MQGLFLTILTEGPKVLLADFPVLTHAMWTSPLLMARSICPEGTSADLQADKADIIFQRGLAPEGRSFFQESSLELSRVLGIRDELL
jgi:hypothetical protein